MIRFLTALAFGALCASPALAQQQALQDCSAPAHRGFDFWIGEWDAYVTGTENLAGRSSIRSEDSGCVITEHWTSVRQPFSGRSLNIYLRDSQRWEQFWVDSTGGRIHFLGEATDTGMRLVSAEGPTQRRMTFTHNADGTVRQFGETSADGATWTAEYDFTYRRR